MNDLQKHKLLCQIAWLEDNIRMGNVDKKDAQRKINKAKKLLKISK